MAIDTEITKVRIVIRHLLWQIREVRKDRDAAWKWVNRFANTLQYQDLEQDPDQYALAILAEARSFNDLQQRKQQMRWVRAQLAKEGVTSPTQEQLDEKWLEMYGNETTADGDIREDSQAKPDGSAITRNETRAHDALEPSANHYTADAPTREDGEFKSDSGDAGNLESATSATHSATTPCTISADDQGRRTGGSSARGMAKVAQPPVRSLRLPTWDEFNAFIDAQGLDYTDAREWWEMTMVDREGHDRDGKPIWNWKAALKRFCAAKINNRRSA